MALTSIDIIKITVGDVPANPFYPVLDDEYYQFLLDSAGGDIWKASAMAAVTISMTIAHYPTRERTGDIEIWNEYAKTYLKALENIINTPVNLLPSLIVPYAGGVSKQDMFDNDSNQDNVRPSIYQGFDKGERVYNHSNNTEDESSYFGIEGAAPYEGWNI